MAEGKQAAPAPETTELHVPETMHIETAPEPPPAEAEHPVSPRQAAMARIVERAEEQRQREKAIHREIARASGDDLPEETPAEEPAPEPSPAEEPPPLPMAAAPEQPAPQKRLLNINGTNVELTDDEMAQLARMGAMASMQQRQVQQQPAQPAAQPAPQAQQQPAAILDNETAKALAKKVLFGDEESGAEAFQDLAAHLARLAPQAPAIAPEQIAANAARQAYAQIQYENNLHTVGAEFPDIFADDNLTLIAAKKVGELRQKYAVLQQPRTDLDLYREAAKDTNDRYVRSVAPQSGAESSQPPAQAAPQATVQSDRLERKRAAPKIPAAANRTASMPEAPKAPTGSEIVAWMKKTRGQPYVQ